LQAEVILFDRELSPRQQRNLERELDIKVLDRTAVILDVFAQHARTREGMLQVELAQNEYRLPRLTRLWTHLARQAGGRAGGAGGGVGLRGPGETQIEIDRRLIGKRISVLKVQIDKLRTQRRQGRRARQRAGLPVVALVGYTNAGKSTVLNAITGTHVYAADKLFATLDPTTRRIELPSGRQALMTDTVGFIQKLPTQLSAAFRATLEEIEEADLLLHVVDVTHPDALQQAETVEHVLDEMGLADHPMVVAANKIDLLNGLHDLHDDGALRVTGDGDEGEAEGVLGDEDVREEGVGSVGVGDRVLPADPAAEGEGVPGPDASASAAPARQSPTEPAHEGRMAGHPVLEALRDAYPDLVVVSAVEPYGLDQLLEAIDEELGSLLAEVHLLIPFQDGQVVSRVHEHGMVEQETHSAEGTTLVARVPVTLLGALTSYRIDEPEPDAEPEHEPEAESEADLEL
jgi:GTP-binding protein HflX